MLVWHSAIEPTRCGIMLPGFKRELFDVRQVGNVGVALQLDRHGAELCCQGLKGNCLMSQLAGDVGASLGG